jgi:hypothetical protein
MRNTIFSNSRRSIMAFSNNAATADEFGRTRFLSGLYPDNTLGHSSAVSWGAIAAGAAAAAALSLILLMLGVGLGLSSVSPWAHDGAGATTIGISSIVWITLTQLLASGMGGYLAGRLRTRWMEVATDEIYFRDTAHGFLAWAIASLATAALLTSAIGSIVSNGTQAGASVVGGAATAAVAASAGGAVVAGAEMTKSGGNNDSMAYFVDSLFRKDLNAAASTPAAGVRAPNNVSEQTAANTSGSATEVSRIFINTLPAESLPPEDVRYAGQLVAQRTGLTQQDAEKRVTDTYAHLQKKLHDAEMAAREAADKARRASAYTALWLFISLLIGAFIASLAATYGGRRRDA